MLIPVLICGSYVICPGQNFPTLNISQIPISGQVQKANGKVYITAGDIFVWDGFRANKVAVPLTDNKPLQAKKLLIRDNIFWIESNDGVSVYNSSTGARIIYSQTQPNALFRIKDERDAFFLEDANGQMYLIAGLLYKINKVTKFPYQEGNPLSVQDKYALLEPNDVIDKLLPDNSNGKIIIEAKKHNVSTILVQPQFAKQSIEAISKEISNSKIIEFNADEENVFENLRKLVDNLE